MKLKKFAAMALSVVLAAASMPISGLAATSGILVAMSLDVEGELLLGGTMQLTPRIETCSNAEEAAEALKTASNAAIRWTSDNEKVATVDQNGLVTGLRYDLRESDQEHGNMAVINAVAVDEEWMINGSVGLVISAPDLSETTIDRTTISPEQGAVITPKLTNVGEGLKADYYTYESSNKDVNVSTAGYVTAGPKAGNGERARITVTAYYHDLPIAECGITVTVEDTVPVTGALDWAETAILPVMLHVNSEIAGDDTYSIPFKSNYNNGFTLKVADESIARAQIVPEQEQETGIRYVQVQALKAGTTELTLGHDGVREITAQIVVFDSSQPAEIIVDSLYIPVDVEIAADYLTQSDFFDEIPDAHKEEVLKKFAEVLTNVNENTSLQSEKATPVFPDNIDEILMENGYLKPGENVELSVVQSLASYVVSWNFTDDSSEFYFSGLTFDVEPYLSIYDVNGDYVTGNFLGELFEDGKNEVEFILPVPDDSADRFKYVQIAHRNDALRWPDVEGPTSGKYVSVVTRQFSPFEMTFTDDNGTQEGILNWGSEVELPIRLYVNSETEGDDIASVPFESEFDGGFEVRVANETIASATLNLEREKETDLFHVEVKALKPGATEVTVSHEGAKDITARIVVTDSAKPAEVIISSTVKPVDIDGKVEELLQSEEMAELPEADKEKAVETLKEALTNINENTAMQSEDATPVFPDDMDAILLEKGLLKPGETAVVSVEQTLEDYEFVVDSSSGSNEFYMTKMVFEVEPVMTIYDENDNHVASRSIGDIFEDGENEVRFILPIPDASAKRFRYAKVTHRDDDDRWPKMEGKDGGRYVSVSTNKFSQFTVEFTDTGAPSSSDSGSGWVRPASGGSGSGSNTGANMNARDGKSGQWQQNEKGWWFRYTDGTYPRNEWVELEWQNVKNWYHFDAEGYIETGWKQEGATWYYLHAVSDGTLGHMYTGWHQIDGKWYYFSTAAGGPLGAMLSNTTTPDGFQLGADGAWIQ